MALLPPSLRVSGLRTSQPKAIATGTPATAGHGNGDRSGRSSGSGRTGDHPDRSREQQPEAADQEGRPRGNQPDHRLEDSHLSPPRSCEAVDSGRQCGKNGHRRDQPNGPLRQLAVPQGQGAGVTTRPSPRRPVEHPGDPQGSPAEGVEPGAGVGVRVRPALARRAHRHRREALCHEWALLGGRNRQGQPQRSVEEAVARLGEPGLGCDRRGDRSLERHWSGRRPQLRPGNRVGGREPTAAEVPKDENRDDRPAAGNPFGESSPWPRPGRHELNRVGQSAATDRAPEFEQGSRAGETRIARARRDPVGGNHDAPLREAGAGGTDDRRRPVSRNGWRLGALYRNLQPRRAKAIRDQLGSALVTGAARGAIGNRSQRAEVPSGRDSVEGIGGQRSGSREDRRPEREGGEHQRGQDQQDQ